MPISPQQPDATLEHVVAARMLIGGEWVAGARSTDVIDPFRGSLVGTAPVSGLDDLDAALDAATKAKAMVAALPGFKRSAILEKAAQLLADRIPEIAKIMTRETGKAIKDSTAEVERSMDTIKLSAGEAVRIEGRHVPLDAAPMGAGKIAMLLRFPVGVVAGITPFNAPFNLACHKVAPAFAAGNAIVLKAPPQAPLTVHALSRLFAGAGMPAGSLNVLYGGADLGRALVADLRVDFITFTGSTRAGAEIKAQSGLRRVALELGGNGSTLVHEDADIAAAAAQCARNASRLAGQSCISVQNIHVHAAVLDRFIADAVATVKTLRLGDPLDSTTDVGTLIDEPAARRVESWIEDAVAQGARILVGGKRRGAQIEPTLLTGVSPGSKVVCEEVFGPVASIIPYQTIDEAIDRINASPYGLQCGIFTRSTEIAFRIIREIRAGGIIVNGSSTWRTDQLPYGGVKASGIGREGPRYAIEDLTEQRLVVFNL
mgnify:FL=1